MLQSIQIGVTEANVSHLSVRNRYYSDNGREQQSLHLQASKSGEVWTVNCETLTESSKCVYVGEDPESSKSMRFRLGLILQLKESGSVRAVQADD